MKGVAVLLALSLFTFLASPPSALAAGIGLEIAIKDEHVLVTGFKPDCPASRQTNIKLADEIIKIQKNGASDWVLLKDLTLGQIRELLEGNQEQSIKLQLHRAAVPDWVVVMWRQQGC